VLLCAGNQNGSCHMCFTGSDPDAPRCDLGAIASESRSASDGGGLVARVNRHNSLLGMRSRTRDVRPISREMWSDLLRRSHIVSVKSFRLQSGVVYPKIRL